MREFSSGPAAGIDGIWNMSGLDGPNVATGMYSCPVTILEYGDLGNMPR